MEDVIFIVTVATCLVFVFLLVLFNYIYINYFNYNIFLISQFEYDEEYREEFNEDLITSYS